MIGRLWSILDHLTRSWNHSIRTVCLLPWYRSRPQNMFCPVEPNNMVDIGSRCMGGVAVSNGIPRLAITHYPTPGTSTISGNYTFYRFPGHYDSPGGPPLNK